MNIIVCPHELAMGGSQINAIELAASMRDRGHQVIIYSPEGELSQRVAELGLEHVVSPSGTRLSWSWWVGLIRLAWKRKAALIHTYEWATSVGCAFGAHLFLGAPQVMTVLSMDVPQFLPKHLPLIVGTEALAESAENPARVFVIEPPVNVHENTPENYLSARKKWNFAGDELVISMVCRMSDDLGKVDGVLDAIEAVGVLHKSMKIRLLLVGDGLAIDKVHRASEELNRGSAIKVVIVQGEMIDPRPAYDAADVSVGMGSSVLRALSFEKPVIVQGSSGFCRLVTPESMGYFAHEGFYGEGGDAVQGLVRILKELEADPAYRIELGVWGRTVVQARYSLDAAGTCLESVYDSAMARSYWTVRSMAPMGVSAFRVFKHCVSRSLTERAGV